jgi:hypothetical protein
MLLDANGKPIKDDRMLWPKMGAWLGGMIEDYLLRTDPLTDMFRRERLRKAAIENASWPTRRAFEAEPVKTIRFVGFEEAHCNERPDERGVVVGVREEASLPHGE